MSTNLESENGLMMYCASCGIAGADDINLRTCTACKFVRYCSVKCQKEHRLRDDWRFSFRCFDCIVVCVCVGKVEAIWGGAGIFLCV
mmetsp:Transcript_27315/g.54752  ORF Transcript_27315/g.54752 Transcript_27315/m.54752 type:complete len:87 (-) Transcript_27315:66-326(-)